MKLKKLFAGLISLAVALIAICAITVCAGAETSGDYEYSILDDGTVEITDYYGSATNLTIPATLDGKKVTSIGGFSFDNFSSLKSVKIPNGVTSIGDGAFEDCSSLTSIDIPDSITSIGRNAFSETPFLGNQTTTVKYAGKWAVDCDNNAESAIIKSGTIGIAESAFSDCSSLTSINIPNGVTNIESYTFINCSSLTSVNIPDGVTSIGFGAFSNCSSLASVTIPDSVISIENFAFSKCSSLTSINIPDSVTSIGECSFQYCTSLNSAFISDSVTSIGAFAFAYCENLKTVAMPDTVESMEIYAFSGCKSLSSINIPNSIRSLENCVFSGCSSLTSIDIPNSVTSIGENAFSRCTSLTSITIPDSVTNIEWQAFANCSNLSSINIPNSVTYIDGDILSGTPFLDNQTTTVKYAGKWAIACDKDATTATIKAGIVGISERAFDWCSNLTSVTIPDTVTIICERAFNGSFALKDTYFTGTKSQWDKISIDSNNAILFLSNIHFAKEDVPAPSSVTALKLKARAADALRLTWTKNDSADGYIIEMKDGSMWTRVGKITNNSTVEFKKSKLKAGTAYTFRVCAYKMDGKTALYSDYTTISARTNPSAVSGLKLKARAADALRLTWAKNTSADGYIIEMKSGSSWTRVGKITKNSTVEFKKSKLKAGTAYTFRVKAYKMSGKTALYGATKTISVRTNPSVVSGLKLKASAKDAVRLSWNKNTSADGYIIEMKSGSKWTRVGKITKNSTAEFKKSKLKAGTAYTFRIKAYKMSGKTALYGATKTITVKTK